MPVTYVKGIKKRKIEEPLAGTRVFRSYVCIQIKIQRFTVKYSLTSTSIYLYLFVVD